ncbi:putative OmpL-like beta-barrel porin-2 [Maribacter vaceletii]|uniref:Putative OmpL-like beta-barrel porin-2 n=1 Tax=Maribacter vaceletii TaxID=1206816 RepID=A0A495E610_9FLAO|nr:outer membrane beta-barrel protein [Maribacter vaceletii]RKR12350.1 putative OmpL-like beta-barrel porin-2 [Maribacter vaceletii]
MKKITNTKYVKNIFASALMLVATTSTFAQDEEAAEEAPKLEISGSVDAYYRTAFNDAGVASTDPGTAFANQTGFALGMGNLIASYDAGKVGAVLDIVVGPRGAGATFNTDIVDGIVNQAYVYWNVSDKTTLTMGRFNTFLGYEVIAPQANFNYSTSYLFSNGPFSHMGLKADFALSDDFSLMVGVMNPWDTNDISGTGEYSFGAQLGFYGQYLNFYYDSGKNGGLGTEIDFTGGFDISDAFFLGINAAYDTNDAADTGFYGVALYPQIATSDAFSIGLRGEYFASTIDGGDNYDDVTAITLTGSYSVDNLILKPEFRLDSIKDGFTDSDGAASDSLATFALAAIYSF